MKVVVLLVAIILIFSACDNSYTEKEMYGVYVPIHYKNTFDTILLKPNGEYNRKIYDRNNKIVLQMNGKWVMKGTDEIQFYSYFLNLDRDVSKFPELLKDTTGGVSTIFETHNKVIQFCVGYHPNENCYKKMN